MSRLDDNSQNHVDTASGTPMHTYRRFLGLLLVFIRILMAPFLLNGIVLYNAGELLRLDEIAQSQ